MEFLVTLLFVLLVGFLFCIAPRLFARPDRSPLLGVYYAHRGLHDNATDAPENSLAAFRKAVEQGYGIEMDVRLTKDKVPVVFHDAALKRVCGVDKRVCDLTYEELQQYTLLSSGEKIPRFAEVLELVDGQVPLIIEWKMETTDPEVCALCAPLLDSYKGVYCIESFNPAALLWYRKHNKGVLRGQLSAEFSKEDDRFQPTHFIVQHLLSNAVTRPDFIAYDHRGESNLSRRISTRFFGGLSVAWTIRSQEELENARPNFAIFIFDSFIPDP